MPSVTVLASAMTQRVKRARIAILGALIPLNNPVRIAEEFAMIDNMCSGRLIAGLLRGAPYEYLVYNVNPAEVAGALRGSVGLDHEGLVRHPALRLGGAVLQISICLAVAAYAATVAPFVYFRLQPGVGRVCRAPTGRPGHCVQQSAPRRSGDQLYRTKAREFGWEPTPDQIIYQVPIHVADTDDQAKDDVRPYMEGPALSAGLMKANRLVASSGFFRAPDQQLAERFVNMGQAPRPSVDGTIDAGALICGSPRTVIEQIRRLRTEASGAGS